MSHRWPVRRRLWRPPISGEGTASHHPQQEGQHELNSIQCIGNLTAAPELRSTPAGKQVATLRLAIDRRDRAADPVYVDVTVWNGLAAVCGEHLAKGRRLAVTGRLGYRQWEAEDGSKRSKHEIVAQEVDFLAHPAS